MYYVSSSFRHTNYSFLRTIPSQPQKQEHHVLHFNSLHFRFITTTSPTYSSVSTSQWVSRQVQDPYVRKAKIDGYRSRAAYKLEEMDKKFKLFKVGNIVLDLGCAPGSWSQYVSRKIISSHHPTKSGLCIGLDLQWTPPILSHSNRIHFFQQNIMDSSTLPLLEQILQNLKCHIILSDMAPPITGISITDQSNLENLIMKCTDLFPSLLLSSKVKKEGKEKEIDGKDINGKVKGNSDGEGGIFVCKVWRGECEVNLKSKDKLGGLFQSIQLYKPKASRNESKEGYLICKGYLGGN